MKNINPELIVKARAAKSVEELLELAKANNIELTEEEAKTYFAQLNANGAVSDDELDIVSGGKEEDEKGCFEDGELDTSLKPGMLVKMLNKRCPHCQCQNAIVERGNYYFKMKLHEDKIFLRCLNCKAIAHIDVKVGDTAPLNG